MHILRGQKLSTEPIAAGRPEGDVAFQTDDDDKLMMMKRAKGSNPNPDASLLTQPS